MTTRTSRISPHTLSPHTILDHLAALTHCRISSGRVRIPCPAHGGANPNLALWVNDDGIAARCHSTGCSYADIAAAIETRFGLSINPRRYHDNSNNAGHRGHDHQANHQQPGPNAQDLPTPRAPPLAPLRSHSQLTRTPRPAVARTAANSGGQSYRYPDQSAGSAPDTCTVSSREPVP